MERMSTPTPTLSIREAAALLGVSTQRVCALLRDGLLDCRTSGCHRRPTLASVTARAAARPGPGWRKGRPRKDRPRKPAPPVA